MSKFNLSNKEENIVFNYQEARSQKQSAKMELISSVLSWFVEDSFYRTKEEGIKRLKDLVREINDPIFTAKLAIYARTQCNMRSVSHVLAGCLTTMSFSSPHWDLKKKSFFDLVVQRPDDMAEILGLYASLQTDSNIKLPNALRKGFKKAFNKFNDYQLSKYQLKQKDWNLIDIVNVIHPTPQEINKKTLQKLIKENDKVIVQDTWEANLSKALQNVQSEEERSSLKKIVWEDLILNKKLGYMALLRNLRNILSSVSDSVFSVVLEQIQNPEAIANSKLLPFRFYSAYKEIKKIGNPRASKLLEAISNAADIALKNTPIFEGQNLIVLDTSGSMESPPSVKSDMTMIEIGAVFAASLYKVSADSDLMIFSDNAQYLSLNRKDSLLSLVSQIEKEATPSGTSFCEIFKTASRPYDRIIILSDMQGVDGYETVRQAHKKYQQKYVVKPKVFNIDMKGYGSLQFKENEVYIVSGWSDKILDLISIVEKDPNSLVNEIDNVIL